MTSEIYVYSMFLATTIKNKKNIYLFTTEYYVYGNVCGVGIYKILFFCFYLHI